MKNLLFFVLFMAFGINATAQTTNSVQGNDAAITDEIIMPEYPGGIPAIVKYLGKHLKYPRLAEKYGVGGRVLMKFVVEKDGSLSEIEAEKCTIEQILNPQFNSLPADNQTELKRQFSLLFAKEAYRVVKKMKKWTPGKLRETGEPVKVLYHLPINFKLR